MFKVNRSVVAATATTVTVALLTLTQPAAADDDLTSAENVEAQLQAFSAAHPGDFVGFDALAFELTGERTQSVVNGVAYSDATTAQAAYDAEDVPADLTAAAGNFPIDSFDVGFQWAAGPDLTVIMTGYWNWRDDFIGGASEPYDVAAIQLDAQQCLQMRNHSGSMRLPNGDETGAPVLRDSGVATKAPVWNVPSRASGFENSGDNGNVFMVADMAPCGHPIPIGGSFSYEGNQGGSVLSVSASFGSLSVSYSNPGQTLQKSTAPIYAG